MMDLPKVVYSRTGGTKGKPVGGTRCCPLEGCSGLRICVRWPGGKLTWPCSKGLKWLANGGARIL